MFRLLCTVALLLGCLVPLLAQSSDVSSFDIPATDDGLPGAGPIRRYDWFQRLWKQKRAAWAKEIEQDQHAVVFLGDSITQGWGPNLRNAFAGMKVANRGISGDTTRGMLLRLEQDVLSLNPAGVVMLMGTNDLEEGADPSTIAANAKLILDALKAHNRELPIVLCQVFPSSALKKRSAEDISHINELFAEIVKEDSQVTLLDTWTLFANKEGDAKKEEFPDLLHPNEAGYRKWASALRPILATLGFLERDADGFQPEPGYTSLFNGHDLDGWQFRPSTEQDKKSAANWQKRDPDAPPWPILTEPTLFDDKVATTDGRYIAKNGRLVVTTPSEGRKIQQFWTQREFPNDFVLKLEFRATPNADSGIFIRGRQLQCRDYALAGPYKQLSKYKPQDWNEIIISVKGTSAYCTCNGELLEADFEIPANGPIGLEGDRGQVEYRRIRVEQVSSELPRSTPEQQGVASVGILEFVDALEQIDSVHSFMLLRRGNVIAEGWWAPFERDDPHQLFSLSKSFASTAVGLAVEEGKLSINDSVVSFFPDQVPEDASDNLKAMRIRDLLSMSTGHISEDLRKFSFQSDSVLTKDFLSLPVKHLPGTHFLYNTPATYMCSAIVQKVTGQSLIDYLTPRLFNPLGIEGATWSESQQGIALGGFGLSLRTEDIARFGQLLLQRGEWNGRQLISQDWVEAATSKQTSNGSDPESDWNQGYGFQFWRCRHNAYRGDGAFGQFCIVMPEEDAVLAVTSGAGDMGAIMRETWDHLPPSFQRGPLPHNAAKLEELEKRLANLTLPTPTGKATSHLAAEVSGKHYVLKPNDLGLQQLEFDPDDTSSVTFSGESSLRIPIGSTDWVRERVSAVGPLVDRLSSAGNVATTGIATSGAWSDPNTFHHRIWFYESPYRLDLTYRFEGDSIHIEGEQNVGFDKQQIRLEGSIK